MEQQMQEMTLQRNRVRSYLKEAHCHLQKLDVSEFGMLEDAYYDAPEKPSPNYVDDLRLTKSKKALKVKASVDALMKAFVQGNSEVVNDRKTSYHHGVDKYVCPPSPLVGRRSW